ncbi:MAG: hypothetical protein Hyperionvirus4_1, partial [Hyperionvirus sp.]
RLCPVYYKFNPDFFVDNISNQKVFDIYKQNAHLFQKIFTVNFLAAYCSCMVYTEGDMIGSIAAMGCEEKCVPCKIYNFDYIYGCCICFSFVGGLFQPIRCRALPPQFIRKSIKYTFPTKTNNSYRIVLPQYETCNRKNRGIPQEIKTHTKYKRNYR